MQRSVEVAITGAGQRARGGLRGGLIGAALIGLLGGCAGGDDKDTSGFSGFIPNPSATNPTGQSGGTDEESSGEASESGSSTSPVEPTTTDPTTGPMTTGPMTTGPMTTETTSTGPMTTDTTTTGPMTTDTTTTTGPMTTDTTSTTSTTNDPPPPKDPQPANGLYADCFAKACDNQTDGCFELQDANMAKIDGYCTLLCNSAADCVPKPNAPAQTECVDIGGGQKVCMLKCAGVADCPTGMTCEGVDINGGTDYCW